MLRERGKCTACNGNNHQCGNRDAKCPKDYPCAGGTRSPKGECSGTKKTDSDHLLIVKRGRINKAAQQKMCRTSEKELQLVKKILIATSRSIRKAL